MNPLNMPTLVAALQRTFQGCDVEQSKGVGMTSHHCEVTFDVYNLRVIMSCIQDDGTRDMNFRFIQRVTIRKRVTKVTIIERKTKDPQVILDSIKEVRALLLGSVYAIRAALNKKPIPCVQSVDDLLWDNMEEG